MKKGISFLAQIIDRFFGWLEGRRLSSFGKSFYFLFQILELFIHYKVIGSIEKFKDFISKGTGFEELANKIKDKTLDQVWSMVGINGTEIIGNIKNSAKKIPYVGDILTILDSLVIALGSYLAIKPALEKL